MTQQDKDAFKALAQQRHYFNETQIARLEAISDAASKETRNAILEVLFIYENSSAIRRANINQLNGLRLIADYFAKPGFDVGVGYLLSSGEHYAILSKIDSKLSGFPLFGAIFDFDGNQITSAASWAEEGRFISKLSRCSKDLTNIIFTIKNEQK